MSQECFWPSRIDLQDKSQNFLSDIVVAVKDVVRAGEASEEINKTIRQFATLDSTLRNTQMSLERISSIVNQTKQKTSDITESLKPLPKLHEGLHLDELVRNPPSTI
ncbi:hypothetical protein K7432_006162 [Basidiobolus ranarum]|uniref:BLOC-1-related complex subunit 7 n=1 Tax=Basidiobolus ranarum TaxID=34480 RepID=A0ABR2WVD7_9FUNG